MKFPAALFAGLWSFSLLAAPAPPANDNFAKAVALTDSSGSVTGATIAGATKQKGEPTLGGNGDGDSVWYTFTAPSDGVYVVSADLQDSAGGDLFVALLHGSSLPALKVVQEGSQTQGVSKRTLISAGVHGGQKYYLRFDTYNYEHGKTGTFNFTYTFETAGAFAFVDAPDPGREAQPWRYREGSDSQINLTVGRLGGSAGQAGVSYHIDADSRLGGDPLDGTLQFQPGDTRKIIHLTLADDSVAEGTVTLNAQLSQPTGSAVVLPEGAILLQIQDDEGTPPNDQFENAQLISATPSTVPVSTPFPNGVATTQAGEISYINQSIWYKVVPTVAGSLTISSLNYLNVFTGDSISTLKFSNEDGPQTPDQWSFTAAANQAYYVEVGNFANSIGSLNYTLDPAGSFVNLSGKNFVYNTAAKKSTAQLTVTRTGTLDVAATVHYATAGSSDPNAVNTDDPNLATPGVDFTATEGALTFAPGVATQTFDIQILRHRRPGQKQLYVIIDNPSGTVVGEEANLTIFLNDGPQQFTFGSFTFAGGLVPQSGGDGLIRIVESKTGVFTANIRLGGKTYVGHGQFPADYSAFNMPLTGPVGTSPLTLSVAYSGEGELVGLAGQLLSGSTVLDTYNLTPSYLAEDPFAKESQGRYTVSLVPGAGTPAAFQAPGWATVAVAANSHYRMVGTLPDGTKFTAGGFVDGVANDTTLSAAVGIPLYHGAGLLDGTVTMVPIGVRTEPPPSGDGIVGLRWARPSLGGAAAFAVPVGGAVSQVRLAPTGQVLSTPALTLEVPTLGIPFTLESQNRATFPAGSMDKPKVIFSPATGLFSGSFTPAGGHATPFHGVILPDFGTGTGSAVVGGQGVPISIAPVLVY